MKYYVLAIPLVAAVALGSYFAGPTNSVTVVPKKHTKLFYDRIEPDPNATMIIYRAGELTIEGPAPSQQSAVLAFILRGKPCKMPRRVKWQGRCWLPERIPDAR